MYGEAFKLLLSVAAKQARLTGHLRETSRWKAPGRSMGIHE